MPVRFPYSITRYIILFTVLSTALAATVSSQPERNLRGIPYYHFFTSRDFDSGASSVFITTAADGTIFYGDRNWILLYDGSTWHKVYQNSGRNEKITSLRWDADGKLYAAGFNIFGELAINDEQEPSFRPLIPADSFQNGEAVEKITTNEDAVYLTGRRSFAYYDKAKETIDLHILSTWLTASFLMDGQYHLLTDDNDILRYENGQLVNLPEISQQFSDRGITVTDIEIDSDGSAIMASERKGIFRFDGKTLSRAYPNFEYSPNNLITDIEKTTQRRLIIASLGGGISVIDQEGNSIEQLGPSVDYRFQSARAVHVDHSGAVWAIFNNTAAKILLDSPLTAIDERIRPSFFYASQHVHKNDLYVRSFYILYKAVFGDSNRITHFVNALPDEDLEVWSVAQSQEGLYINSAKNGIYLLSDGSLRFMLESQAFDRFEQSKSHPNYLLGVNSDTIALFEKTETGLQKVEETNNPGGFINRLLEDKQGLFWIEYGLGRTAKVRIDQGSIELDVYDTNNGLPRDEWGALWIHEGIAHLNTTKKTMILNPSNDRFEIDEVLQDVVGKEEYGIGRAFTDPNGNLWMSANNKNLIFWLQEDGSYLRDETSLSEMGEPYFESIEFLENGDALIMTAFEFFHFRNTEKPIASFSDNRQTNIIKIENPNDEVTFFTRLGNQTQPDPLSLLFKNNNLKFTVSNTFNYTTLPPQFEYLLEGFSEGPIDISETHWSKDSHVSYTNLSPGNYVFKTRTKLGNGTIGPWTSIPFAIAPPLHQTWGAYLLYIFVSFFLILILVKFNSTRLRKQNLELEEKVKKRTSEIETQNKELESQSAELKQNAAELAEALIQLNDTQDKLLTTARIAGRAEVATNVLHSVGNVLNSVNIGLSNLDKQVQQSRARKLKNIVSLIKEHENDLAIFLQSDERGKHIPNYLEQLSEALHKELESYSIGIHEIDENVDHIKNIIATQQSHAKKIGVEEDVIIAELIESALTVTLGESYETSYRTERLYDWDLVSTTDKHLVLDAVINLIKNAKDSLRHKEASDRLLIVGCKAMGDDNIEISVTDNGLGIEKQSQHKLFTHGFTTKADGHGFGLHSSANAIKSRGGSLKLESPGPGKGATATITLPK